jgi:hypothetical protein
MKADDYPPQESYFSLDPTTEQHIKEFYWQMQLVARDYQEAIIHMIANQMRQEIQKDQKVIDKKRYFLLGLFCRFIQRLIVRLLPGLTREKFVPDLNEPRIIDVYPVRQGDERRIYYE